MNAPRRGFSQLFYSPNVLYAVADDGTVWRLAREPDRWLPAGFPKLPDQGQEPYMGDEPKVPFP